MAEPQDEDDFPNDFDGLDFDTIPGLQAPAFQVETTIPSASPPSLVLPAPASPASSIGPYGTEDMDSSFLAAVDALEAHALNEMPQDSESSSHTESGGHPKDAKSGASFHPHIWCCPGHNHFHVAYAPCTENTRNLHRGHEYPIQSPESCLADRKGKRKVKPQEGMDMQAVLAGYETELICPICYDLIVGAQVANPCGHTSCGACSYKWLARNKYEPTCAVCRSGLSTHTPLLPNFCVDNFVQQHLLILAKSGRPEWQERGYKAIEWNKRLESWKEEQASRTAMEKQKGTGRSRRRRTRYYEIGGHPYAAPWTVYESTDDDGDDAVAAHVAPRRGTRARH